MASSDNRDETNKIVSTTIAGSEKQVELTPELKEHILSQPRGVKREFADDVADPRHDNPKEDLHTEGLLDYRYMSRKERRAYRRAELDRYTEGMNRRQRIGYFFTCHQWKILMSLMVIVSVSIISYAVYRQTRPVAISYGIINSTDPYSTDDSVFDDYKAYYGIDKTEKLRAVTNLYYDLSTWEEDYNENAAEYSSFPLLCGENMYDILITDRTGLECCSYINLIYPLDTLGSGLTELFEGELADYVITAKDSADHISAYAVDISGTEFAERLNIGYDDVYLCFPGNSDENQENVRKLLNYIFELGLY